MHLLDRLRNDFVVLRQLVRGMPRDAAQSQGLQAFYGPQAAHYDEFRDRLFRAGDGGRVLARSRGR